MYKYIVIRCSREVARARGGTDAACWATGAGAGETFLVPGVGAWATAVVGRISK